MIKFLHGKQLVCYQGPRGIPMAKVCKCTPVRAPVADQDRLYLFSRNERKRVILLLMRNNYNLPQRVREIIRY